MLFPFAGNVIIEDNQDDEKEEKTDEKDITPKKSTVITPKKKRKSNMEKSLESAFNHFKKSADEDFVRYLHFNVFGLYYM